MSMMDKGSTGSYNIFGKVEFGLSPSSLYAGGRRVAWGTPPLSTVTRLLPYTYAKPLVALVVYGYKYMECICYTNKVHAGEQSPCG